MTPPASPDTPSKPAWQAVRPGVRQRTIVRTAEALLVLYEIAPGHRFPAHVHSHAQLGLVLQGGGRHVAEGAVRRLRAGDSYYVPPNVYHEFRAQSSGPTVLVDVVMAPTPEEPDEAVVRRMLDDAIDIDFSGARVAPATEGEHAGDLPRPRPRHRT